tara:strand:- start:168 stop:1295 length:1128 start_codon:yes stop_codon:yes gene_type:complete
MTKAAELAKMGEVLTNSQIGGRRNIVINGAMQVAQRATSVSGLGDDNDENYPTVDRFEMAGNASAGRLTMSQESITDLPGFTKCIKLDCTTPDTTIAATERLFIQTKIEGQDLQAAKTGTADAKPFTLSFYAKASASFKFVAILLNVDNDRFAGTTFDVTTSWQRIIITFPADVDDGSSPFDNDNADSLHIRFFLHAGSNYVGGTLSTTFANALSANSYSSNASSFYSSADNNFFFTGVQFEIGSVATPFEHNSYAKDLLLCQRYFQWIPKYAFMVAVEAGTTTMRGGVGLPTNMRANPTIGSHNLTRYDDDDNTFSNKTPVVFANSGDNDPQEPEAGGQSGHLGLAYNSIMSGGTDNHNVTTLFSTQASLDAEL